MIGYYMKPVSVRFLKDRLPDGREIDSARKWAFQLMQDLDVVGDKYAEANRAPHLETDRGESRPMLLASTILTVVKALQEMPGFARVKGMAPMHDLLGALLDLHAGKLTPLLQPRDVTASPVSINTGFVRRYAILCVRIMQMTTMKETAACNHVAATMRRLGYKGRKKGPFPISTLTDWVAVLDDHDKAFLMRRLQEITADKGASLTLADAERLVEGHLTHDMMLSKR